MSTHERLRTSSRRIADWLHDQSTLTELQNVCASRVLAAIRDLAVVIDAGIDDIDAASTATELTIAADALAAGEQVTLDRWVTGCHFNAAKLRVLTAAEMLQIAPYGQKAPASFRALKEDVNAYKHRGIELHANGYGSGSVTAVLDCLDTIVAALTTKDPPANALLRGED